MVLESKLFSKYNKYRKARIIVSLQLNAFPHSLLRQNSYNKKLTLTIESEQFSGIGYMHSVVQPLPLLAPKHFHHPSKKLYTH